jgi:hypothetical protein
MFGSRENMTLRHVLSSSIFPDRWPKPPIVDLMMLCSTDPKIDTAHADFLHAVQLSRSLTCSDASRGKCPLAQTSHFRRPLLSDANRGEDTIRSAHGRTLP